MPILDAEQQFYFSTPNEKQQKSSKFSFFLKYLPIASQHLKSNLITMEMHPFFRDKFLKNIEYINQELNLSIPPRKEVEKLNLSDYFLYFYERIQNKNEKLYGNYIKLVSKNKFYTSKAKLKCFEPFIESQTHRWYFTDTSIVILSISDSLLKRLNESNQALLILQVYLLKSLGFTIVLCMYLNSHQNYNFIFELIRNSIFSEVHLNIDKEFAKSFCFDQIIGEIISISNFSHNSTRRLIFWNFYCYLYLYISYSENAYNKISQFMKGLKNNPYNNKYFFSVHLHQCFKKLQSTQTKPFAYCSTGFDCPKMKVHLCRVPLYDDQFDSTCISPSQISPLTSCYITPQDFIAWKGSRVEVLFDDDSTYYVEFDDLHLMKPELFVKDTLYFMKADQQSVDILKNIKDKADEDYEKNNHKFIKKNISTLFKSDKNVVIDGLSYLYNAVRNFRNFTIYRNQLFTAFEASLSCLFNEKSSEKGIVYQLETGQGKSVIIQMIAALLAKTGKTVHIATSNIHLANRDFADSRSFFKGMDIESAVLLHSNEIPQPKSKQLDLKHFDFNIFDDDFDIDDNDDDNDESNIDFDIYKSNYYTSDKFENSLDMNLNVCGLGNDIKENTKNQNSRISIIYSTFINFEALYLKMMENWPSESVNNYFNERFLIVDEADTILIDELTNGTILSRSMPSNAPEVLSFIYQCKMGQLTPENIQRIVDFFYPNLPTPETVKKTYLALAEKQKEQIRKAEEIAKLAIPTSSGEEADKKKEETEAKKIDDDDDDDDAKTKSAEPQKADNPVLKIDPESILTFVFLNSLAKINMKLIKEIIASLYPEAGDNQKNELFSAYGKIRKTNQKLMKAQKSKVLFDETKMKDLLQFLSQTFNGNPDKKVLLELIKKNWTQCVDLNEMQLQTMLQEIELVHTQEFTNGRKYLIDVNRNARGMKRKIKKKNENDGFAKFIEVFSKAINYQDEIEKKIKDHIKKKKAEKELKEKEKGKVELVTELDKKKSGEEEEELGEEEKAELITEIINEKENEDIKELTEKEKSELVDDLIKENQEEQKKLREEELKKKEEEKKVEKEEEIDETERLEVYPYDYNNKGILETNKEFNGFIHQFIAIKEKTINPEAYKKLKIRDITINYLYVSHPIFTKLYRKVCGFTGTVGKKNDKKILKNQYELSVFKIPRNEPNLLVKLPTILCRDNHERNKKIFEEVVSFHELNIPVLVVLRDLNDLNELKDYFVSNFIININVFNGTNISISPEKVAGLNGAISLGTNFCGRGTDIKTKNNPLHVIVGYYSSNCRAMQQAFGRTARKGEKGTCRIICMADEYIRPTEFFAQNALNDVVNNYIIKKQEQLDFIEKYRLRYDWLFSHKIAKIKIDTKTSGKLKESRINVNRITACTYKYPVGMSIETFLSIQAQKIYSLYNCPNCIYTWLLFQRYVREMILESWSLLMDKVEMEYFNPNNKDAQKCTYHEYLTKKIKVLRHKIHHFLPKEKTDMLSSFMKVHDYVSNKWSPIINNIFYSQNNLVVKPRFPNSFFTINLGFIPYSLLNDSGSRIENFRFKTDANYCKDPELIYLKSLGDGRKPILISITSKLDNIFDLICQTINNTIGDLTGLRFFMRRTIAGCEFGACIDLNLENVEYQKLGENCLIDKDPLLLFSIHIKSLVPILLGVLVIVLVFVAKICLVIVQGGLATIGKKLAKITLSSVIRFLAKKGLDSQIRKIFLSINGILALKLQHQIDLIRKFDAKAADLFTTFAGVFVRNDFKSVSKGIAGVFSTAFKFGKRRGVFEMLFPYFFKLAIVLILNLAAFIMNFNHNKEAIDRDKSKEKNDKFDINQKSEYYQGKDLDQKTVMEENEQVIDSIYNAEE